ncbi:hypothetical protein GCM10010399_82770 [Dactylosporangium fulvum]|uniref:Uncharacterized protein n=1 Tax=Dactylosporangium fulvum TaxID=53359 RepID=A0ABY5W6Y6_9ACTN|nr:hypothetical protein [Dactylosporangium fulvum]UWP85852.1 hypothetical protein Dfulv_17035 [Dactylosporangium fulvum]
MSNYVVNEDGSVILPGDESVDDWHIRQEEGGWVAWNAEQGYMHDGGDRHRSYTRVFATRDEALAALEVPE